MQGCDEYEDLKRVVAGGYYSPEMLQIVKEHEAICVKHGGTMPGLEDLQAIFSDMFARVGHQEICKGAGCRCGDDPPAYFENEVVKQFKRPPEKKQ